MGEFKRFITAGCAAFMVSACASNQLDGETVPLTPAVAFAFEATAPSGEPFGWYVEGDASKATINVDTQTDGSALLRVANSGEEPVFVYTVLPTDECHKTLTVEIDARSDGDAKASGVIVRPLLGGPDFNQPQPLSTAWSLVSHTATSTDCLEPGIGVGALLFGDATLRSIAVYRDEQPVSAKRLIPVSKTHLNQLRAVAVDEALQGGGEGIAKVFSKKIIALGETSHGAAALFEMKLEILKSLAGQGNLGALALELPAAAADVVNEYVSGRSDDRTAIINALVYPAWQTEEMLAVIDWLRSHNASSDAQIEFLGFDVQHPVWAARGLLRAGVDRHSVEEVLAQKDRKRALLLLDKIETRHASDKNAKRYTRLLRRGLLSDQPDLGGKSRDYYMADETLRLAETQDRAIVLWADNTHITKSPGAMGHFLHERLGENYAAIGMTFALGEYSAYGPDTPYPADPAYDGTHEKLLADANLDRALLAIVDLPVDHPLHEPRGWRYIGSRPQEFDQFLPHRLRDHFDAVGFVRESAATNYLHQHEFQ